MAFLKSREFTTATMLIIGIIIFVDYVIVWGPINILGTFLKTTGVIVAAAALGLGAINIVRVNIKQWNTLPTSEKVIAAWMIAMMLVTIGLGLMGPSMGSSKEFLWIYVYINQPIAQTVYALTFFYIFYAAWRSFRVRSIEATILMLFAILIMLYNIPLGAYIPGIVEAGSWVFRVPSGSAQRGLEIATALGVVIMGIRTLIGKEMATVGSEEEVGVE